MTDTNILNDDTKALFAANDFPLMPASQIAEAVFTIVTTGRTGECWVCQPGRDAGAVPIPRCSRPSCRGRRRGAHRRPSSDRTANSLRFTPGPNGNVAPMSSPESSSVVPKSCPKSSWMRRMGRSHGAAPATDGEAPVGGTEVEEVDEQVLRPTKLIRIASMVRSMLDEVRRAPLDDAGRRGLREIHERSVHELEGILSPELRKELREVALPLSDPTPSESELRLAQAQLVGWLEGLFHGIQATLFTQQATAQQQFEEMRRRHALEIGAPDGTGERAPGQYL